MSRRRESTSRPRSIRTGHIPYVTALRAAKRPAGPAPTITILGDSGLMTLNDAGFRSGEISKSSPVATRTLRFTSTLRFRASIERLVILHELISEGDSLSWRAIVSESSFCPPHEVTHACLYLESSDKSDIWNNSILSNNKITHYLTNLTNFVL